MSLNTIGAPQNIIFDYFKVIKAPPFDIIEVDIIDDTQIKINNLYKKLFQFKYRFVYDDNEKSVWSAISKVSIPAKSTDTFYNILNNVQNVIQLKLSTGDINVSKIEIAGRVNIENEWSDFFLVDTLDKKRNNIVDNTIYSYFFRNDSVYIPIDLQESNLLFDYVPDKVNALELANGNTLVVGGLKDGYNRDTKPEVLISSNNAKSPAVLSTLDFNLRNANGDGPYTPFTYNSGGIGPYNTFIAGTIIFSGTPQVGDLITIKITGFNRETWIEFILGVPIPKKTIRSIEWTYSIVVQPGWGIPDIINAFNTYSSIPDAYKVTAFNGPIPGIPSSFPSRPFGPYGSGYDPNTLYFGSFLPSPLVDTKEWRYESVSVNIRKSFSFNESDVFQTYKWNGLYRFGLVYYDKDGKTNGVFTNQSMAVRTGSYDTSYQWTPPSSPTILPENSTFQLYIGHEPPSWASYYHIVRTKDLSCDFSLMVIAANVTDKNNSGYMYLDIQNIVDTATQSKETSAVIKYGTTSFVSGDRVRIYQKYNSTTKSVIWDNKEFLDLPILDVEISTRLRLKLKDVDTSSNSSIISLANGDKAIIEIYRPAKVLSNEDLVYYEIGYKYNIVTDSNGNRYHDGQSIVQNATLSTYVIPSLNANPTGISFTGDSLSINAEDLDITNIINGLSVGDFFTIPSGSTLNASGTFSIKEITKINNKNIVIKINETFQTDASQSITIAKITKPGIRYAYIDLYGDGDYYYKTRTMVCDTSSTNFGAFIAADRNFSETYLSAVWSQGRPLVVDEDIKEEYFPAMLRFSQSYIYGTNINNLSRFYPNNFEEADASFGDILRLKTRENFIRLFQRYKVGMIPIFRQIIIDNANSSQVALSERLLNKPNYYSGEYGIDKYGSSLVSTDYGDYFIDTNNKTIVRVSLDGVTNISDTFDLASWANSNITEDSYGYGCFNYENRNVIMLIGARTPIPVLPGFYLITNNIVAYSESDKFFESFYGFTNATNLQFVNGFIFSGFEGKWYIHDSATRNNFFGTQQSSAVTTVFNGNLQLKKTYTAIEELSNGLWTGSISTGPLTNQLSSLATSDFQKTIGAFTINSRENKFNATIKRDQNSAGGKYQGDTMKGLYAQVALTNSLTTEQRLISVSLKYIPSPLTNS